MMLQAPLAWGLRDAKSVAHRRWPSPWNNYRCDRGHRRRGSSWSPSRHGRELSLDVGAAGYGRDFRGVGAIDAARDGKAPGGVAAKGLKMHTGDGFDSGPARGVEVAEVDEVVGQGSAFVACPGGEGREQRALVDEAGLEGEQSEEEIAISIDGGHNVGLPIAQRGPRARGLRRRGPHPGADNRIGRIIA